MNKIETFCSAGIIEPEQLKELLESGSAVRVLDATFVLPGSDVDPQKVFAAKRIGDAAFFDVHEIADKDCALPHMLPSPEEFAVAVSALGISNDDFVIVYAQHGMVMGPARAWWMFRVFGHDRVCVLNGGLPAWEAAGLEIHTGAPVGSAPSSQPFKADFRADLVADINKMQELSECGAQIYDARPMARFSGEATEPRAGMRSGHIPGSSCVPASSLVDGESGKMKPLDVLQRIFDESGLDRSQPIHATCGSGVTACMLALALFALGSKDVVVYDGSWSEWGCESQSTPVKKSIP
ncbi:rhodanese-like domain-containing protein [Alphaproteobacteria bacterium]|nr:rhodanese-like domain-containing protein [Alphaproteobacteria bacterium]